MVSNSYAKPQDGGTFSGFRLADLPLFAFFVACFIPVNIGTLSVNYLFMLYPLWGLLTGKRLRLPSWDLVAALGWFVLIFIIGEIFAIQAGNGGDFRALSSFIIFVSIFALLFMDLTQREIQVFKAALLAGGVLYSMIAVFGYFWAGGNAIGFAQKDVVGSQRYGFIYLAAFFVVLSKRSGLGLTLGPKVTIVLILLAGMLLTFSRSTIVTFSATVAVYVLVTTLETRRDFRGGTKDMARRFGMVIGCLVVLFLVMPLPFNFYNHQILARYIPVLEYFSDNRHIPELTAPGATQDVDAAQTNTGSSPVAGTTPDGTLDAGTTPPSEMSEEELEIVQDVFNSVGSEGTRLVLWSLVMDYVNQRPLVGSHYLGVWTIEGAPSGSVHNQLFDVLLRTGWPGFAIYVLLMVRLLYCLYRTDRGLFWGLVATLIFGSFHETFKESQGAFFLAFLIGMLATTTRSGLLNRSTASSGPF